MLLKETVRLLFDVLNCVNVVLETNCDILHEQGIEKVLLSLLDSSSAVLSCCMAITALSSQLTTCKQLIGKEGKSPHSVESVVVLVLQEV